MGYFTHRNIPSSPDSLGDRKLTDAAHEVACGNRKFADAAHEVACGDWKFAHAAHEVAYGDWKLADAADARGEAVSGLAASFLPGTFGLVSAFDPFLGGGRR